MLQTLADGLKLILKEGFIPDKADPLVYRLAPYFSFVPAFLVVGADPARRRLLGRQGRCRPLVRPQHAPAARRRADGRAAAARLSSIAVYGIMLAGMVQRVEVPAARSRRCGPARRWSATRRGLGLSLATVLLLAGTLSTSGIVGGQDSFGDGTSSPPVSYRS